MEDKTGINTLSVSSGCRLSVLGAGAWGTALAIHFAQYMDVSLWSIDADQVNTLLQDRVNSAFLPGYELPARLMPTASWEVAMTADIIIVATPTAAIPALALRFPAGISTPVIIASKGFVDDGGEPMLSVEYLKKQLGPESNVGVLSGPSFAQELAQGKPTALTLAFSDSALASKVAKQLHVGSLRVYSTTDTIGVSVGGAVKNVMAIATGLCDGMQLGANARAALITRGLAEIIRFGVALGAKAATFSGLAGMGDLILTTTGDLSRNRQVGLLLAQGKTLEDILQNLGHVAEGVMTARIVNGWAKKMGVDMPISAAIFDILTGNITPKVALEQLIGRDQKFESVV